MVVQDEQVAARFDPDAEPVLPITQAADDEDGEALPAFLGEDEDDEDEQGSAYAVAAE